MIDATVAPKVGFISPFGTTVCNVNHINAGAHLLPEAGATQERTLEAVRCSARLCQHPPLKVFLCFQQPRACMAMLPSRPERHPARTTTLGPSASQPRAASSRGISTRFTTRRRLYARTVKLYSVRTFCRPRMKQEPASHHRCIVPHGCSTNCMRCFITSGRRRPRCSMASHRWSSTHRVSRRPPVLRVHCGLRGQALQADVASERIGRPGSTVAKRNVSRSPAGHC